MLNLTHGVQYRYSDSVYMQRNVVWMIRISILLLLFKTFFFFFLIFFFFLNFFFLCMYIILISQFSIIIYMGELKKKRKKNCYCMYMICKAVLLRLIYTNEITLKISPCQQLIIYNAFYFHIN